MSDVTIIGGGWSVRNVVLDRLCGTIIAVNDSALLAPHWDHAVSMDRLWTENRLERVMARARAPRPFNAPERLVWIRKNALQNIPGWKENTLLQPFDCDHRSLIFSRKPSRLNGTNSGMCALNLAWQMRPQRLFLLGFDMNRDPDGRAYWYPPYPWSTPEGSTSDGKYKSWAKQFADIALAFIGAGVKVFNVSPSSAIDVFPKITPSQFMRECR